LPHFSANSQAAALGLKSYVNTAVGCFGFEEGIFFLDCCRVQQIAPAAGVPIPTTTFPTVCSPMAATRCSNDE
jgi:hypothetical protein